MCRSKRWLAIPALHFEMGNSQSGPFAPVSVRGRLRIEPIVKPLYHQDRAGIVTAVDDTTLRIMFEQSYRSINLVA